MMKRYSDTPFPMYRFRPGKHPHPREDAAGHAFGQPEAHAGLFHPSAWQDIDLYLFGVDLYNYGYWWEAHEAWEALWRVASVKDGSRDYLQGLIKIAGAYLKWHAHNHRGLTMLYASGTAHLCRTAARHQVFMGLHIPDYLRRLEIHTQAVLESEEQWPDPQQDFPVMELGQ